MTILSFIYWNPKREAFTIPFINHPIVWYGVFFAFGFAVGYYIFLWLLQRYLYNFPEYSKKDILDWEGFTQFLKKPPKNLETAVEYIFGKTGQNTPVAFLNKALNDPAALRVLEHASLKLKRKCHVCRSLPAKTRFLLDELFSPYLFSIKQKARKLGERYALYIIIATVIGARLGHFLFYEDPSDYLRHPWVLLQTWKGGLASHGAAIAIIIAIYLFSRWAKKIAPLSWLVYLDLIAIPTAFAGVCIRLGNFFNQEILGKTTTVFWAIQFGSPMDGSLPAPRHPVQLYEALCYFFIFWILLYLSYKPKIFLKTGKLMGLFLILVFTSRFFVEFWKVEQSEFFHATITMGQILSLPFIVLGFLLYFWKGK